MSNHTPQGRFLGHFRAFWGLSGPQHQGLTVVSVRPLVHGKMWQDLASANFVFTCNYYLILNMRPNSWMCQSPGFHQNTLIYCDYIHMNPIWVSAVPQGSIIDIFCFLLLSGKLLLKIADRQAHNATQRVALWACRSAVFSRSFPDKSRKLKIPSIQPWGTPVQVVHQITVSSIFS